MSPPPFDPKAGEAQRRRIITGRNNALALVLLALVVLFFAITIVKVKSPRHMTSQPASAAGLVTPSTGQEAGRP